MKWSRTVPAFLAAGAATIAIADDASLQGCRAIADATRRLACYDAIPLGRAPAPSASPAAPGQPAGAAPAAPPQQTLLQRFGFESRAQPDELPFVDTHIPGTFTGWGPRTTIALANGQVWQVTEETSRTAYLQDPKVKITRGALGSFFMEIEGVRQAPRVRRVQ